MSTSELRLQKLQACTEESCYISARSQRANGSLASFGYAVCAGAPNYAEMAACVMMVGLIVR